MYERYAEGIATGRDEGITVGEQRGIPIGSHERAVVNARSFLQMGLSVQQVAQGTGLPLDEVQSLL